MTESLFPWFVVGTTAGLSLVALMFSIFALLETRRRPGRHHHTETAKLPEVEEHRPTDLVSPPPMIDGVTLFQWIKDNHRQRDGVWGEVVRDFYRQAEANPAVAHYFAGVEMHRLRVHFTRALMIVTKDGLTRATVQMIKDKHEHLDIPDEVYRQVIALLASILDSHGVPTKGIQALATTIEPLRGAIVYKVVP